MSFLIIIDIRIPGGDQLLPFMYKYIYIYHDVFETAKLNMHTIKFFLYKIFQIFFYIFKIMVSILFAIRIEWSN